MLKAFAVVVIAVLVVPGLLRADVRDDYRTCEQKFLSKIRRGIEPQASLPVEEYCLGLGYWFESSGNRLVRDPSKAVFWHKRAVEHGSRQAMVALGYHYEKGHGVSQDLAQAVRLYQAAADLGDASAMFNLGRLYSIGRGVPKNEAESQRWMQKASLAGSTDARVGERKSRQYQELESAERESYQRGYQDYQAKDYRSAAAYLKKAADAGNASAQEVLGSMYRQGLGVEQDLKKAAELYRSAAVRGHARAQAQLGFAYETGEGVREDWAESIEWYKKSATQLSPLGLYALGRAFQFGLGVPQDRVMAMRWFEKAENQGDQQAGYFAKWLRVPGSCLGYIDDQEREKFAGVCSDPKGITFKNSKERRAWLAETLSRIPVDFFGSTSYQQVACSSIGGDFRSGNCYGHGGAIIDPFSNQDRFGRPQW